MMSQWINIRDRLPEYFVGVLITDDKIITCAELYDNSKSIVWIGHGFGGPEWDWDFDSKDITGWMPLPELL